MILLQLMKLFATVEAKNMENETSEEKRVKQCPNCKTFVQYDYSVCPLCGQYFDVPKSERKFVSTPTSPQIGRPRNINVILLMYFFFAAYMLINGLTAIFFVTIPGAIIAGLFIIIIGIIDLVLSIFTRRKLRIAYLAGLIVAFIEIGFFSLALLAILLFPVTDGGVIVTSVGLLGMKIVIVFLLFREKDYFTDSFRKQELPVKESIPDIPATTLPYQTESTEPVVLEYQAESLDQEIKTYLNSAKNSWKIAENSYKNAVWVEFVLRADDAINSLIKGRYIQLFGPIKPGMSIIPMVEAIRLRGYQLPEREDFEKWINFRENIAKGIEKPEEAEIVDAYPFYHQIFDKLGFK